MQYFAIIVFLLYWTPLDTRSYNTGLIFYDVNSLRAYLPPTVSVRRGRALSHIKYSNQGSIWSTFGKPCECQNLICGCCAGIHIKQYQFDQKMCANVTFIPKSTEIFLDVFFNEKPSSKYAISARNPSPFCIPVMMGVPMAMCIQLSDIAIKGNNLNMCMDFVARLASTDLFEMHFQCMRMGLDGIQYVDKNGNPVIPAGNKKIHNDNDKSNDSESDISSDIDNDSDTENDNDNDNENNSSNNEVESETLEQEEVEQENDENEEEEEEEENNSINIIENSTTTYHINDVHSQNLNELKSPTIVESKLARRLQAKKSKKLPY